MTRKQSNAATRRKISWRLIEWQTLLLLAANYLAFGLATWHYDSLPWWLLLPLGGALVCLHGSLQHEAIHGHPTRWTWLNALLVFPSLWLWMPYRVYERSHLLHHDNTFLTDPLSDPESYYVTPERWARMGRFGQAFARAHNTLLGRLLVGPLVCAGRSLRHGLKTLTRGEREDRFDWGLHLLSAGLVLVWVLAVCGIPLWAYLLFFAYPGTALTLLRSFLEHRAELEVDARTVVVEAGPVMSLLLLNNNLHALHHAEPGLAWYRLKDTYRAQRGRILQANGHYHFSSYWEIARRYLLTPKEPPAHPLFNTPTFSRLRVANDPGRPPKKREVA